MILELLLSHHHYATSGQVRLCTCLSILLDIVLPDSCLSVLSRCGHRSFAVSLVILPVTYIDTAVCVMPCSVAVNIAIFELADIFCAT